MATDDLAALIAGLPPQHRAELERRLSGVRPATDAPAQLDLDTYPLTFAQERLWLWGLRHPDSAAYHRLLALRLDGDLDLGTLRRTLFAICARHQPLRSVLGRGEGGLRWRPAGVIDPPFDVTDLRDVRAEDLERTVRAAAVEFAAGPFALELAPPIRIRLLRTGQRHQLMLICLHHLVSDGWSDGIFVSDLARLYDAEVRGVPADLPSLPVSFGDYARWQREPGGGDAGTAVVKFWAGRLAGPLPKLTVPGCGPAKSAGSDRGALHSVAVDPVVVRAIQVAAATVRVTPYAIWLAAFALVIAEANGEDLIISVPLAGRERAEVSSLIGCFANTMPLRVTTSGSPSFAELARRIQEATWQAMAHQEISVGQLASMTSGGNIDVGDLMSIGFAFQNTPQPKGEIPGLALSVVRLDPGIARGDVICYVWAGTGTATIGLEYRTEVVSAAVAARLADRLVRTAERAATAPDATAAAAGVAADPAALTFDLLSERSNLTRNQLLIWLDQQLRPDEAIYNIAVTYDIAGPVDQERFAAAIATTVAATDVLGMRIAADGGVPMHEPGAPQVCHAFVDFSADADPAGTASRWCADRMAQPLRMHERLYESALLRITADRYIWYMCCHHVIADGWSMQLLVQRMQAAYQGHELQPTSFARLAEAKRAGASRTRQRASEAYWRAKLGDQDRRGSAATRQTALSAHRIEADLGIERTRALRRLANELDLGIGGPQLAVLDIIAAAAVAWWGAHGHQRIVLGTPFHNRRRGAEREAVGLFMAIYPLCHEIRAGDTLAEIMRRNRAELVGAIRHRDHVVRDAAGERMFDVLVNYMSISEPTFCGMPMQVRWMHNGVADEALAVQLHDFGDGSNLRLQLDVRADVLPEVDRSVLLSQLIRVIDTLLADAGTQATAIELAGPADYAAIAAFNATAADHGPFRPVHELIADHAALAPDRIAVVYEGHHLSYAELERRADALAARLASHGVGREVRVCVFLPRGIEVVIAVLAILKAGGSYVLVDAEQSAARLAHVIADASPAALIAAPGDQRIAGCGVPVFPVLGHDEVPCQRSRTWPGQAAYVTYTSGSTGAPKGCVIEHANLLNSYRCWVDLFELREPRLRHLQMASPSFDVFTGELVRALCSGGTMVVCPLAVLVDPQALHKIIRAEGVTHCEFVPVLLRSLVAGLARTGAGDLSGVRLIATGSDVWTRSDHRQLTALCGPQARLWNGFGLTETSIDSALVRLPAGEQEGDGRLPVGRPMANQRIYILDDRLRPAPLGIAGECFIGGAGVGRGYYAHPALTAERFVPDPFATGHPGARMYRTGDWLRLCADGHLEYLGRSDAQVKVHGARVQPGEIEACLRRHPSVSGAAVVLSEHPEGPAELVAYVVESGAVEASASALRRHLRATLPVYQIPRRFLTIPAIPLTASGKADRAALPAPRDCESLPESALIPPRNDFERLIAGVWCDVLGRGDVSVLDNFFDAGGHSLALVLVHERITAHFGDRVTIPMLFEHPTVAALAAHLAASAGTDSLPEPATRIAAGGRLSRQRSVRASGGTG